MGASETALYPDTPFNPQHRRHQYPSPFKSLWSEHPL
jgi:hypothetical protein